MDVKHRAQDKNGNIFDFEEKPVIRKRDCVWDLSGIRYEFVEYGKPNPDWETACFDLSEVEPVVIDGILCAPVKKQKYTTNCTSIEFEGHLRKTSNLDIKESPEFEDHLKKSSCLGEERKHGHYYKDVSNLNYIDFYRICDLYEITDSCTQHALKKLLVLGGRGHKDIIKDTQDVIDTMKRKLEMLSEVIK